MGCYSDTLLLLSFHLAMLSCLFFGLYWDAEPGRHLTVAGSAGPQSPPHIENEKVQELFLSEVVVQHSPYHFRHLLSIFTQILCSLAKVIRLGVTAVCAGPLAMECKGQTSSG